MEVPLQPRYRPQDIFEGKEPTSRIPVDDFLARIEQLKTVLNEEGVSLAEFRARYGLMNEVFYDIIDYADMNPGRPFSNMNVKSPRQFTERLGWSIADFIRTRQLPLVDLDRRFIQTSEEEKRFFEDFHQGSNEILFIDINLLDMNNHQKTRQFTDSVLPRLNQSNRLIFLYASHNQIDYIRHHDFTVCFLYPAGERSYTERILIHTAQLSPSRMALFTAPAVFSKQTYREWLPIFGLSARGYNPTIIRHNGETNELRTLTPEQAKAIIFFPPRMRQIEATPAEYERVWSMSAAELRSAFILNYPPERCLNEFIIAYGINGAGFSYWIHNNLLYGDGPEAVRYYLLSGISSIPKLPAWLITRTDDFDLVLRSPAIRRYGMRYVEFALVDQDSVPARCGSAEDRNEYPPDRVVILVGNDITYRQYLQYHETYQERPNVWFVLTCDSMRQAADEEIYRITRYLISLGARIFRIVSEDRIIIKFARGLQEENFDVTVVRKSDFKFGCWN